MKTNRKLSKQSKPVAVNVLPIKLEDEKTGSVKPKRISVSALNQMTGKSWMQKIYLAVYGPAVAVKHGKHMMDMALKTWTDNQGTTETFRKAVDALQTGSEWRKKFNSIHKWALKKQRERKRWLAPRLAVVLTGALESLDPKPFEDFAKIIRVIKKFQQDERPFQDKLAHPFHYKSLLEAALMDTKRLHTAKMELPVVMKDFLGLIHTPQKERELESYERREFKRMGIIFSKEKTGRPKKT